MKKYFPWCLVLCLSTLFFTPIFERDNHPNKTQRFCDILIQIEALEDASRRLGQQAIEMNSLRLQTSAQEILDSLQQHRSILVSVMAEGNLCLREAQWSTGLIAQEMCDLQNKSVSTVNRFNKLSYYEKLAWQDIDNTVFKWQHQKIMPIENWQTFLKQEYQQHQVLLSDDNFSWQTPDYRKYQMIASLKRAFSYEGLDGPYSAQIISTLVQLRWTMADNVDYKAIKKLVMNTLESAIKEKFGPGIIERMPEKYVYGQYM